MPGHIAVGISGGVDSAAAALLLSRQGYRITGVTMTLGRPDDARSLEESRQVARRLGIKLEVFDFSREWKSSVLDYISSDYLAGRTPNPCVRCNETVKMSLLPRAAFALGADCFATGHYARVENGRIFRAAEKARDQSYFLYRVPQDVLRRLILPLGEMTKAEVRKTAGEAGFEAAGRADSQDFCGGNALSFVAAEDREGDIVTLDGKVIGRHRGFWNYTVGKRKGLGIGGGTPYYVVRLDAVRNEVVVGFREDVTVESFRLVDYVGAPADRAAALSVKVRSAGEPRGPVVLEGLEVRCPGGIAAVAPGQSAVFYDGDELVGGGTIDRAG